MQTSGYYIINYDNNEGFAIVSMMDSVSPVYGISEEGNISYEDENSDSGLRWYLDNYLPRIESATLGILPIDTGKHDLNPSSEPSITEIYRVPAMLTGVLRKFHKSSPYNKYCYTSDLRKAAVGCTQRAVGALMGYYQYPSSILGYSLYWDSMLSNSYHDGWPQLFERLGRSGMIDVTYGVENTGGSGQGMRNALRALGYTNVALKYPITLGSATSELNNKRPVIMTAFADIENESIGHAWVTDGHLFVETITSSSSYPYLSAILDEDFLHCVWGWGGSSNGYFKFGSSLGGDAYKYDENPGDSTYLWYDIAIITAAKP